MQISVQTILPYRHPSSMSTVSRLTCYNSTISRKHGGLRTVYHGSNTRDYVAIERCGHVCEASVKLKILPFAVASVSKGFSYADYYYTIKIQYIFHLCGLSGHADYVLCFHPETKCLWIVQIL